MNRIQSLGAYRFATYQSINWYHGNSLIGWRDCTNLFSHHYEKCLIYLIYQLTFFYFLILTLSKCLFICVLSLSYNFVSIISSISSWQMCYHLGKWNPKTFTESQSKLKQKCFAEHFSSNSFPIIFFFSCLTQIYKRYTSIPFYFFV